MTDKELITKIKTEIERRISFHNKAINSCTGLNNISLTHAAGLKEDEELLSFISDLEKSEKPEADLEKEIEISIRLLNGLHTLEDNKSWYKGRYEELKELARNFYDLGCSRTAEKYDEIEYNRQRASGSSEIPKDLEEAAEEYAKEHSFHPCDYDVTPYDCFKAGAKWDKEQMMEEAVEKSVCLVPSAELGRLFEPSVSLFGDELKGYVLGDRVHIIIVKEDEK